jgi:hypothetical protein
VVGWGNWPVVEWSNWPVGGNLVEGDGKLVVEDGEFGAGVVDLEIGADERGDGIGEKCVSAAETVVEDLEDGGKGDQADERGGDRNLGEDERTYHWPGSALGW